MEINSVAVLLQSRTMKGEIFPFLLLHGFMPDARSFFHNFSWIHRILGQVNFLLIFDTTSTTDQRAIFIPYFLSYCGNVETVHLNKSIFLCKTISRPYVARDILPSVKTFFMNQQSTALGNRATLKNNCS